MKEENKLIVADQSWADAIPEWILKEISAERMINGIIDTMKPEKTAQNTVQSHNNAVGDAEIVAYLMTASLRAPISSDFTDIYLYVSAKVMLKAKKIKEGETNFIYTYYDRKGVEFPVWKKPSDLRKIADNDEECDNAEQFILGHIIANPIKKCLEEEENERLKQFEEDFLRGKIK